MSAGDLSEIPMLDLFRMEAETQTQVMTSGLLALERDPIAAEQLELCMRAAHSLKGAARIVGLTVGVSVAHAMEDCFVAAQHGRLRLGHKQIDLLLAGTDLLGRIANTPEQELGRWTDQKSADVEACVSALARMLDGHDDDAKRGSHSAGSHRSAVHAAGPGPTSGPSLGRARQLGSCSARHGGKPEPAAWPGGPVDGRVALGEAVRRIVAEAQADAPRGLQYARHPA